LSKTLANRIVVDAIKRIKKEEIKISEAMPALVSLVSIEGSPFEQTILQFVHNHIQNCTSEEESKIIEALSNIPTRESAKIILSFLTESKLKGAENTLISGLARIGDVAIYESLEWAKAGHFNENCLFKILIEIDSPLASKILWEKYQLTPPEGFAYEWARTWALRLPSKNTSEFLRHQEPNESSHPLIQNIDFTNYMHWPYGRDGKTALAALTSRVIEILSPYYTSIQDVLKDIDLISRFSLRVQIPLLLDLVQRFELSLKKEDEETLLRDWGIPYIEDDTERIKLIQARIQKALFIQSPPSDLVAFHFLPKREERSLDQKLFAPFNNHSWHTIRGFMDKAKKEKKGLLRTVLFTIGVIVEIGSILLVTLGIRALLPPDGTYTGFFFWLPLWARIIIPSAIVGLVIAGSVGEKDFWMSLIILLVIVIILAVPMLAFFTPIFIDARESLEKILSTKKLPWREVIYTLLVSLACGILIAFAIRPWCGNMPLYLLMSLITLIVVSGIYLSARAMAFQENTTAQWLNNHPRGREVLDEFVA
jgi:hypothetical protein